MGSLSMLVAHAALLFLVGQHTQAEKRWLTGQLLVRSNGEDYPVFPGPENTVGQLKQAVTKKIGMPDDQYELIYQGRPLDNKKLLGACNIKEGPTAIIQLEPRHSGQYKILVHGASSTYNDREMFIYIQVASTDTIAGVKEKISAKTGIPAKKQLLRDRYDNYEDNKRLSDYNIRAMDTIIMNYDPEDSLASGPLSIVTESGTLEFMRKPETTVQDLKSFVAKRRGWLLDQFELVYKKDVLEDGKLSFYHIGQDERVKVRKLPKSEGQFVINVRSISHNEPKQPKRVQVNSSDTIAQLKENLASRMGIKLKRPGLYFKGKELANDQTLADYNIQAGDNLTLATTRHDHSI